MMRVLAILLLAPAMLLSQSDDLGALFDAYRKEREASPLNAAAADKLAARAAEARKNGNVSAAARLIRDARWSLAAVPDNLPDGVQAFGMNKLRHGGRVNAVRYSRDGSTLLTSSNDQTARLWDVATGREKLAFRGVADTNSGVTPPIRVADAVFLTDGERAASVSNDGLAIHIWNLKTGKLDKTITPENVKLIKCIAVTDDGKSLVTGSDDRIVRLWDLESGKETFKSTPQSQRIESVSAQPKGKFIAAVDAEGYLSVFDPSGTNKSPLMRIQVTDGSSASAFCVRFTPDGTRIITGGQDRVPKVTSAPAADGAVPPNVAAAALKLPAHGDAVIAVASDGRFVFSAGRDKMVRAVDDNGEVVRSFTIRGEVTALDVRPDGKQIAVGLNDGTVQLLDFLSNDEHSTAAEAKEPLWASAVNTDGTLMATGGADKIVRLYTPDGKLSKTLEGSTAAITCLAFLPESKLLSAGGDKLLRMWDVKAGKALGEWKGHDSVVLCVAASADGKSIASGTADKVLIGWTADGKKAWSWTARTAVTAIAFTNDAKRILVGTADGGITVLAIKDGEVAVSGYCNAHISGVAQIAFEADGARFITVGGDGIPKLWTLPPTGNPTITMYFKPGAKPGSNLPLALSTAAISPDGRTVATAGADRLIRLFDAKTGTELRSLRGCNDWITSLSFLAGDRLLAVAADKAARIFDVTRFDEIPATGHSGPVYAVAISADGKTIASGGEDKVVRLWNRATGEETGTLAVGLDGVYALSFIGPNLLVGGKGGPLALWDLKEKKAIATTKTGDVFGLFPSPDGGRLGVFGRLGNTNSYSVYALPALDKPVSIITETTGREVSAASCRLDYQQAVSADKKGKLLFWNFEDKPRWPKTWAISKEAIIDVVYLRERALIVCVDASGFLRIGDPAERKVLKEIDLRAKPAGKYLINAILVSPVGERLAVIQDGGEIRLFDFDGKELKTITLPTTMNNAAFSADGKTIVTANVDGSIFAVAVP